MKGREGRRVAGVVALLAATAVLSAACSNGAPTPRVAQLSASTTNAGAASSSASAAHLAGQCLRDHGLANFPDPAVATDGPAAGRVILDKSVLRNYSDGVVNQALDACRAAMDQAGILSGQGSSVSPQQIQSRLTLARCIRAHGVPNFPDPNPTTGDVSPPPGLTKTSPSILAALAACPTQARAAGITVPSSGP